jgi:hypothetical protein
LAVKLQPVKAAVPPKPKPGPACRQAGMHWLMFVCQATLAQNLMLAAGALIKSLCLLVNEELYFLT